MDFINAVGKLVEQFGLLAVVVIALIAIALMFSRTWTRAKDTKTELEGNANEAQKMVNDRFNQQDKQIAVLRADLKNAQARITELEQSKAAVEQQLKEAHQKILDLETVSTLLQSDKRQLAAERDTLRADLDRATTRIHELELSVIQLTAQLNAEKSVQATIIQPMLEVLQRLVSPPAPPPIFAPPSEA